MAPTKTIAPMCFAAITTGIFCQDALPQTGRTIRLIVPVPPGASTDVVGRLMAETSARQGVTVVVKIGRARAGMIGTEFVSRAAPDGNTLLMTANTYLIDAQTRKASYHPVTAFDPIRCWRNRRRCSSSTARHPTDRSRSCWRRRAPTRVHCRWLRSDPVLDVPDRLHQPSSGRPRST